MLYKYRPANERTLSILAKKEIWFASPESFNDPFDGFIDLPERSAVANLEKYIASHSRIGNPYGDPEYAEELRSGLRKQGMSRLLSKISKVEEYRKVEKRLKRRGILTLSETDRNILMWSHYAEEHKGICIGIEVDSENVPENMLLKKVEYVGENRPVLDKDKLTTELEDEVKILTTKFKDWEYEKEWRFILRDDLDDKESGRSVTIPGSLISVSIGLRAEDDFLEKVKSYSEGIALSYLGHSYFGFGLEKFQMK